MTQHRLMLGRVKLGAGPLKGAGMRYGTTGRCTCGAWKRVNEAPSKGGAKQVQRWYEEHTR